MIKLIEIYIIKKFCKNIITIFISILSIFITHFGWQEMPKLIEFIPDNITFIKLLICMSSNIIPIVITISILLASITTISNLTETKQILALKSCGISSHDILNPLLIISIIISISIFLFNYFIVSKSYNLAESIYISNIKKKPLSILKEKKFLNIKNYYIRIGKIKSNNISDIQCIFTKDLSIYSTLAKKGIIYINNNFLFLELYDTKSYINNLQTNNIEEIELNNLTYLFNLKEIYKFNSLINKDNYKLMNGFRLKKYIKNTNLNNIYSIKLYYYRIFSYPITIIIFFFIGSSIGFFIRKGGIGLSTIISIFIFIIYFIINFYFENTGENSLIPVSIVAWAPNIIFTPISLYLYSKITNK